MRCVFTACCTRAAISPRSSASRQKALARAAEIQAPVLVMHGADDIIALPEGSQRVAEAVPGDATLKVWPGLYHFIHHEPDMRREVPAVPGY